MFTASLFTIMQTQNENNPNIYFIPEYVNCGSSTEWNTTQPNKQTPIQNKLQQKSLLIYLTTW